MSDSWPDDAGNLPPTVASTPAEWSKLGGPTRPPAFGERPTAEPPPPAPPASRRWWWFVGAVAAAIVLVAIVAGLFVTRSTTDSASPSSTTTTTSTTSPTTTQAPGSTAPGTTTPSSVKPTTTIPTAPAATPAELEAAALELGRFVEKQREATFRTPVKTTQLADDEFDKRVLAARADEKALFLRRGAALSAFGVTPSGDDLETQVPALLVNEIAFYDPSSKELLVRGRAISPYLRSRLVYQLTRALDDQLFGLSRPDYVARPDEIAFAFLALTQGDASRIDKAWQEQMPAGDRAAFDREGRAEAQAVSQLPTGLLQLYASPERAGEAFVDELLRAKHRPGLDAAFVDPPVSSEQILHSESFLAGDKPAQVDKPKADGKVDDEGIFGELPIDLVLIQVLDPNAVFDVGQGWSGDWYVLWKDEKRGTCARVRIQMDTDEDGADLKSSFDRWAETRRGAATVTAIDARTVEVTSCSGGSGGGSSSPA